MLRYFSFLFFVCTLFSYCLFFYIFFLFSSNEKSFCTYYDYEIYIYIHVYIYIYIRKEMKYCSLDRPREDSLQLRLSNDRPDARNTRSVFSSAFLETKVARADENETDVNTLCHRCRAGARACAQTVYLIIFNRYSSTKRNECSKMRKK